MAATEADHFAVDQHNLNAEHVIGGEAVFETVHAPGILRDVAADRTRDLARWVWRVVETPPFDLPRYREVRHARLHSGATVGVIDFKYTIEPGHPEQDAIG